MEDKAELRKMKKWYESSILEARFKLLNILSIILLLNSMSSLLLRFY